MVVQEGDILEIFDKEDYQFLVQGCNSFSLAGSGLANQIYNKYEEKYKKVEFDFMRDSPAYTRYGNFLPVQVDKRKTIINMFTQYNGGPNFNMSAFLNALNQFEIFLCKEENFNTSVLFPYIGCGIGVPIGLDSRSMKSIVLHVLLDFENRVKQKNRVTITLVEYNNKQF